MSATDCVDVEGRDSEASLLWGAVTNGTRIVVRAKPVRMDFRRTRRGSRSSTSTSMAASR